MLAESLDGAVQSDVRLGLLAPRSARQRAECDWMLGDVLTLRRVSARLEARLLDRPLSTHGPDAAASLLDALQGLAPVLAALTATIARAVTEQQP